MIGIDLGNTNTCAAMILENFVQPIKFYGQNNTMPTVASFGKDGVVKIGQEAASAQQKDRVQDLKTLIGKGTEDESVREFYSRHPHHKIDEEADYFDFQRTGFDPQPRRPT